MNDIYPDFSGIIRDYDALNNKPTLDGTPLQGEIKDKILNFLPKANGSAYAHDHDSRYYTETEVNSLLESLRSQFADYSLKSQFADYVIEQGKSGDWNYRKWASGTVECWGLIPLTVKSTGAISSMTGISSTTAELSKPSFVASEKVAVQVTPAIWGYMGAHATDYGSYFGLTLYGRTSEMSDLTVGSTINVNIHFTGKSK